LFLEHTTTSCSQIHTQLLLKIIFHYLLLCKCCIWNSFFKNLKYCNSWTTTIESGCFLCGPFRGVILKTIGVSCQLYYILASCCTFHLVY
jgi:hypothetical protein